jgi:hypothetical protein
VLRRHNEWRAARRRSPVRTGAEVEANRAARPSEILAVEIVVDVRHFEWLKALKARTLRASVTSHRPMQRRREAYRRRSATPSRLASGPRRWDAGGTTRPFQFGLRDILLVTAVIAALVATITSRQATIAFVALGILLMFLWHRPVLLRLWTTGTIGLGCGLLVAMVYRGKVEHVYLGEFGMNTEDMAGWGAGMIGGGLTGWRLFITNPPARDAEDRRRATTEPGLG